MTPSQVYSWFRDADHLMKWLTEGGWRAIGYRKAAPGESFVPNTASPKYPCRDGEMLNGPYTRARLVVVKMAKGDY